MPRTWCWSAASLAATLVATLAALVAATPAGAATVVEDTVEITLQGEGGCLERTRLVVRLDKPEDLEDWAIYPILIDENRTLQSVDAAVRDADGERRAVKRKQQDRVEYSGAGILYDSQKYHVVTFPGLAVGSTIELDYTVAARPYFPAGGLSLLRADPIERLEVTVRGGGAGWRWRIDGPADGLEIEDLAGGVRVRGSALKPVEPGELAAGGAAVWPTLRYAWGGDDTWNGVGRWYRGLLDDVPRRDEAVRALARELIAGAETPRGKLEALVAYLRGHVRYVAVEVGVGGFRPSPPEEVLERKWGDCKDKSLLLVDLLREIGVEAYPALINLSSARRLDRAFPSPYQFNHLIVAVPETATGVETDDPVGDGYLFIDPTQTLGGVRWLHPGVQDQDALVVTADGAELVHTPILEQHETTRLAADLRFEGDDAVGEAVLVFAGRLATVFADQVASAPAERTYEDAHRIFSNLLPGVELADVRWWPVEGEIPTFRMAAGVTFPGLGRGIDPARFALRLPSLGVMPEPRLVADADTPLALRPRHAETVWRIALPAGWCPIEARDDAVENDLGVFRQTLAPEDGAAIITRASVLRQRWIEPGEVEPLRALALAEHRAAKRRVRLECATP